MIITENPSFKLGTIVLSKTDKFTVGEIVEDLKNIGVIKTTNEVEKALNRLRDNDFITQFGSYYIKAD